MKNLYIQYCLKFKILYILRYSYFGENSCAKDCHLNYASGHAVSTVMKIIIDTLVRYPV